MNRPTMPRRVITAVCSMLLVLLIVAVEFVLPPFHSAFRLAMTKEDVISRFGEPSARWDNSKDEGKLVIQPGWPFVYEHTQSGRRVEMWAYRSLSGITILFFVEDDPMVAHIESMKLTDEFPGWQQ